jgi:hypothetical protein
MGHHASKGRSVCQHDGPIVLTRTCNLAGSCRAQAAVCEGECSCAYEGHGLQGRCPKQHRSSAVWVAVSNA